MANYGNQKFSDWWQSVLTLVTGAVTASYKVIQDAAGNATALQLSSNSVKSSGNLEVDGDVDVGGTMTAPFFEGDGSALAGVEKNQKTITTINETLTITEGSIFLITTQSITVTLPEAAAFEGVTIAIKNTSAGSVTIEGNASETIDGAANQTLNTQGGFYLLSDGTAWHIIAEK